ncbi:MAG: hypothetical protein K6A73_00745, partial [Bacteroidales bacterium]|nr:hypothetical protein [Bacteroidales bacterium]
NFYKSLLPSFTTETRQKPAAKGKKTGSNIWILLLVTLGLDIITFISTYSLQLEVLNFIEVLSRFLYVLAIFGISALLHILHKRNGKKFVQVMLVSTIALSLITMFHVIYVSLNVPASQVTNDFSFQTEQTIAISESIASRLLARPGLIEMMLAAIFCIAGVICDLSSGKTNDTITETTPKNEPEELSYREKKLAEVRQDITQTESDIKAEQDAIDVSNKNFSVYLNYNHDKLIEIKNTITKNDEEKDKKEAFLNDTMRKIHKEMCDDRLLRIQLQSRKNNIPVSEIAYEEWTLEDIINYYNQ